ncbi:metal ABC transporter ATP-binding protein [Pseudothermotoga thermarum]|uniref:ABC transporter related protein n=1 Tax=Pseudothermotoga thermarum DSM 5069 TaxID=688269 RepID=F7YU06_9THEM|nr:metal ABC transporter ATP-binding protein [Pseudothermotoga thermarum]AEH51588.1 ABC transporter related protein [Pseudothermotoga thermarum DSM 5069]
MVKIKVENLCVKFGEYYALKNVSFEVKEKEFVGIIGPNGAGKTTLLKVLVGEIKNYSGRVEINGKIGYQPQFHTVNREFPIDVLTYVSLPLYVKHRKFSKELKAKAVEMLKKVGLAEKVSFPVGSLSGGELQRLSLARALLSDADILLLDEPDSGVDEMGKSSFYELLSELKKERNLTIVMVSHDIGLIFKECSTIMCLNKTLHCHAPTEKISPEKLKDLFGQFDIWIRSNGHYEIEHRR